VCPFSFVALVELMGVLFLFFFLLATLYIPNNGTVRYRVTVGHEPLIESLRAHRKLNKLAD
jgi:hypothetical protein